MTTESANVHIEPIGGSMGSDQTNGGLQAEGGSSSGTGELSALEIHRKRTREGKRIMTEEEPIPSTGTEEHEEPKEYSPLSTIRAKLPRIAKGDYHQECTPLPRRQPLPPASSDRGRAVVQVEVEGRGAVQVEEVHLVLPEGAEEHKEPYSALSTNKAKLSRIAEGDYHPECTLPPRQQAPASSVRGRAVVEVEVEGRGGVQVEEVPLQVLPNGMVQVPANGMSWFPPPEFIEICVDDDNNVWWIPE